MNHGRTIALVANSTWNIFNFRLNVIDLLTKKGYQIIVIAPVDKYISYRDQFPNVKHIDLQNLSRKSTNPLHDLALFYELFKIYRKEKPDLILHYTVKPNIYGGFAASLLNIKYISMITGLGYTFIHNGIIKSITWILYKLAFKKSAFALFENTDDRLLFIREGICKDASSKSIKGCGVNIEHFSPNGFLKDNDKMIFTFIGRLLNDKGIREFIGAARATREKYPKTEFWVVGEIDKQNPATISRQQLVEWTDEKVIRYFGPTDDVRYYIKRSDCIVLPSYREGMSRVVQEGMAMKKPIITTDTAGCREAVEEGKNGFLVPVKDTVNLAGAMKKLIHLSEAERQGMGLQGRKKVLEEFDDKLIADQIYGIIKRTLEND